MSSFAQEKTVQDRDTLIRTPDELPFHPPLKWAGGKRWQLPHLRPLRAPHRHRRLIEPFCGGLAVTLGLVPDRAILNDINPHLVNFYRWLKRGLTVDFPLRNDSDTYYAYRERFNDLLANNGALSQEAAALFYYLNRTGYNGLCRFNQRGFFNVPFGRYATINYTYDFSPYKEVVKHGSFPTGTLSVSSLTGMILYTPILLTTWSSRITPRKASAWDDQVRWPSGLRRTPAPWSSRTRQRRASWSSTKGSALPCTS